MAMSIRAWAAGHFRHPRTAREIRMAQENITDDSIRVLSQSTWLMLHVPQRDISTGSGRFLNPVWSFVTGHFDADMSDCLERYPMSLQSCGSMVHSRDSRRAKPLINYCSMDIQQSHLASGTLSRIPGSRTRCSRSTCSTRKHSECRFRWCSLSTCRPQTQSRGAARYPARSYAGHCRRRSKSGSRCSGSDQNKILSVPCFCS